ncbi:hypothetical protein JOF41_006351 [Saccharothrix coeruleofusca]|uniref:hypothetical protein n=1 Tax=Saccharothrix coeruleofusca TaxID=33919 RepID=UPI001AEAC82A|nr:hypothetical protein [Saccharothrix coeruleofusca]MBP2340173.1 hypothetical protein [Saccharothrix coeruleofusca]
MPVQVVITRPAARFRDAMRKQERNKYEAWLTQLKSRGCAAMGYRLHGDPINRLCVSHLSDNIRAVVAFDSPTRATIVALGPHDAANPDQDVYRLVYLLAEVEVPVGKRTKPPCCDGRGMPPDGSDLAEEMAARIHQFAKAGRRR